jgi:hypothetical protein
LEVWTSRSRNLLRLCGFYVFLPLVEADLNSVLPMTQADKFKTLGITPPKGALMYGPPGKYHSTRMSAMANFDQVPERHCLQEHVPPRPKLVISSSLVLPLFRYVLPAIRHVFR